MSGASNRLIDIASRDVTVLHATHTLGDAARLMAQRHFSSIVVTDEAGHPLGIVTERNILHAMRSGSPAETPLRVSMSAPVTTLPGETDCLEAYQFCLREGIRHLVLVDAQNVVCGVVSETDFRLHLNLTALAGQRKVINVSRQAITSLPPHGNLLQALKLMQSQRQSCVIVVDDGKPVGIVTERDVVRLYAADPQRVDTHLAEVMTAPVDTISCEATINEAACHMLDKRVRHLAVVDAAGAMVGLVSEHDLTQTMALGERRERIEVDELFLRTFIDTIPDLVWLKDKDGYYMACNRRFEQFLGASGQDIVGKTDYDFMPREQADSFRAHDREAMAQGQPTVNEEWLHFPDGYYGLFETIKTGMRGAGGDLIGVLGVARDVTERERIRQALQKSEQEFRTLAENLPDNIIRYDRECRVRYINPAMVRTIAPGILPIIGKLPYESDPDSEVVRGLQRLVEQVMDSGQSVEIEQQVPHPDGTLHWHHVIFVAERDKEGKVTGALGIGRDITERKRVGDQLEDYRRRLEGLVVEESTKFRALVEQSLVGIFIIQDGFFRYVNSGLVRMFGFDSASEVVDVVSLLQFIQPEDRAGVEEVAARLLAGDTEQARYSFTARKRDGTPIVVDVHGRRIIYQGRPAIIGSQVDITEMRRSREELKQLVQEQAAKLIQSEELLRTLIETIPDAIQFKDGEGRWLESNSAARAAFGLDEQATRGHSDVELSRSAAPEFSESLLRCHQTDEEAWRIGKASRVDEVIPVPGDGQMHFDVIKVPLFHDDGSRKGLVIVGRDVTELKRTEQALRRSVEEYSGLVRRVPAGVYKLRMRAGGGAVFDYVSPRWYELLDLEEGEALRDFGVALARIHPDDRDEFIRLNDEVRAGMHRFEWEGRVVRRDGEVRWLHIESQPTQLENGDILWDGIQYDITDRRKSEEALRINASVFDNSQEAIVITDADNIIVDVNRAFSRITGYTREEVLGRDPRLLSSGRQDQAFYAAMWKALAEDLVWRGEIWNRRKNGEVYAELLSISAICDERGAVQRHVGIFSDITYFKDHEAELSRVANFDALTGVPNRRLLSDRLGQAIAHAQRSSKLLAVCYIDLDGFKEVNDRYGHEMGDRLLIDITRRLQVVLRAGDTLARLGGDEFVVLFNDLTQESECFQILDRVMQTIALPVDADGQQIVVSASIGVTFYPVDDEDGDTLMRHADQAMYIAKQTGRNRYHLYDRQYDQRQSSMHEVRRRIAQGLIAGEFELYYQPKLELATGKVSGVEALIRWHHPERGLLSPAEFLPIIENSDVEIQLGEWVMQQALAQAQAWASAGINLEVGINISARHLQQPNFVERLQHELERYPDLPRGHLQIEVLETAALEDMGQSSAVIEACRELGVSFALDDFGTGYSSLVYLSKLGAETLKIDQGFVQGMQSNTGDHAIVKGVIALAETFGRQTVAEGLEDRRMIQPLSEMGCRYGQGYGIAYPMPAAEFLDWYKKQ